MPTHPSALGKLVPGAAKKYERAVQEATWRFGVEQTAFAEREQHRQSALAEAQRIHETEIEKIKARVDTHNREVDDLDRDSRPASRRRSSSTSRSFSTEHLPGGIPKTHKIAFVPESKQLVIEFELPTMTIVPHVKQYRYVKARDAVDESPRPLTQVKALYSSVVAQAAVRTLHELFEADRDSKLETVVFNGFVDTLDPATGKPVSPHLVTVRVSRETFTQLDLGNVEPLACLKGLNAGVSKSPGELLPVRPVLEFNMVDPRFIQESDVLSELDARPNLMELSPRDFESLITNLFEKMGLETDRPRHRATAGSTAWPTTPGRSSEEGRDQASATRTRSE